MLQSGPDWLATDGGIAPPRPLHRTFLHQSRLSPLRQRLGLRCTIHASHSALDISAWYSAWTFEKEKRRKENILTCSVSEAIICALRDPIQEAIPGAQTAIRSTPRLRTAVSKSKVSDFKPLRRDRRLHGENKNNVDKNHVNNISKTTSQALTSPFTHHHPSPSPSPSPSPHHPPEPQNSPSHQSKMPLPTILAFHGSGSNSTIHTIQLARLTRFLRPHFDLESLTGPIESAAGPGILPFFEGCGPYYRWLPPTEAVSASVTRDASMTSLHMGGDVVSMIKGEVEKVRAKGGKVVGVVGFSQGTRVVAGLLKGRQVQGELAKEGKGEGLEWLADIRFGLSVCSSFPPPIVPGEVVEAVGRSGWSEERKEEVLEAKVTVPVLHVLGAQDEWRWGGQLLIEKVYEMDGEAKSVVEAGKSGLYVFDIGHHYPVAQEDTEKVADWVVKTWYGAKGE